MGKIKIKQLYIGIQVVSLLCLRNGIMYIRISADSGTSVNLFYVKMWYLLVITSDRIFYSILEQIIDSFSCSPITTAFFTLRMILITRSVW